MQLTVALHAATVRCAAQQQPGQQQAAAAPLPPRRRLLLTGLGAAALALSARPAAAFPGIESIDLPTVDVPAAIAERQARSRAVLDDAEASFQQSGEQCGLAGRLVGMRQVCEAGTAQARRAGMLGVKNAAECMALLPPRCGRAPHDLDRTLPNPRPTSGRIPPQPPHHDSPPPAPPPLPSPPAQACCAR